MRQNKLMLWSLKMYGVFLGNRRTLLVYSAFSRRPTISVSEVYVHLAQADERPVYLYKLFCAQVEVEYE